MSRIYLTFDDGPDPHWTPRVLDVLAQADIRATFFMIGEHARRERALTRRVADAGHAIGNHTMSHRHPWLMNDHQARAQVRDGANALADIVGSAPVAFRPPHGRQRACMRDEALRLGERTVLWSLSAVDWGPFGRAARIERRLRAARSGDILLMHDGRNRHNRPDQLLEVLAPFLREARQRGLICDLLPVH